MDVLQLCEEIRLPEGARRVIESYMDSDGEQAYQEHKRRFYRDSGSWFAELTQQQDYRQTFLYFFVRLASDVYEAYRAMGIEDEIYYDTFSDIRIWCENCLRDYGEYGLEEYQWLKEHVSLRLFRIGRLQFQPYAFDRELSVGGCKLESGRIVLNVHIPQGEPLDIQAVQASFERAGTFFRGIPPIYICNSWLLYPKLAELLPEGSNIAAFQSLFHVYEQDHTARQAEERIFGKVEDDPANYEERTSLQRRAKAWLQAGGKLGNGYGIKLDEVLTE